jgi:hypothetical protein
LRLPLAFPHLHHQLEVPDVALYEFPVLLRFRRRQFRFQPRHDLLDRFHPCPRSRPAQPKARRQSWHEQQRAKKKKAQYSVDDDVTAALAGRRLLGAIGPGVAVATTTNPPIFMAC